MKFIKTYEGLFPFLNKKGKSPSKYTLLLNQNRIDQSNFLIKTESSILFDKNELLRIRKHINKKIKDSIKNYNDSKMSNYDKYNIPSYFFNIDFITPKSVFFNFVKKTNSHFDSYFLILNKLQDDYYTAAIIKASGTDLGDLGIEYFDWLNDYKSNSRFYLLDQFNDLSIIIDEFNKMYNYDKIEFG